MKLLKEILSHEVFPAFGCTEPISVAYAASLAARELSEPVRKIKFVVDPGVYKNGKSVLIPNTGGARGNLIAGVMGAAIAQPELKMEILKAATPEHVERAEKFIESGNAEIDFDATKTDLYIDVAARGDRHSVRIIIESSHTNVVYLKIDDEVRIHEDNTKGNVSEPAYRTELRKLEMKDLLDMVTQADAVDLEYIQQGIDMNLAMAEEGFKLKKTGYLIAEMLKTARDNNEVTATSKVLTASATDGRMAGVPLPVMSSGGAGNQGVVAILVAYNVGQAWEIDRERILKSIVLSHLVNAYVKCYTGDLSVICGCAIAAGMGAAVALVYQKCGDDLEKMGLAVNSVACDLGGIFCDGAKEGCAMKVISSTDAAIRAAYMAINDYGVEGQEGIAGLSPEDTIRNLSRITEKGMARVNEVILEIMRDKDRGE